MNLIITNKKYQESMNYKLFSFEMNKEHSIFIKNKPPIVGEFSNIKISNNFLSALDSTNKVFLDLTDEIIPLTISAGEEVDETSTRFRNLFESYNESLERMLIKVVEVCDKKQKDMVLLYSSLNVDIILDDGIFDDNGKLVPVYGTLSNLDAYLEEHSLLPSVSYNQEIGEFELEEDGYVKLSEVGEVFEVNRINVEKIISLIMQCHSGWEVNPITKINDTDLGKLIRIFNRDGNLEYINYLDKMCKSNIIEKSLSLKANNHTLSLFTIADGYVNNGMKDYDTNIFLLDALKEGSVFISGLIQSKVSSALLVIPCNRFNLDAFEELSNDVQIIDANKLNFLEYFMLTIGKVEFDYNINEILFDGISQSNTSIGYVKNKLTDFNQNIVNIAENVENVEIRIRKSESLNKEQYDQTKKIGKKLEDVNADTREIIKQNDVTKNTLKNVHSEIVKNNADLKKGISSIILTLGDFEKVQLEMLSHVRKIATKEEQEKYLERIFKETTDNLRKTLNDNSVEASIIENKYKEYFGSDNWEKLNIVSRTDMIASKLIYNLYKDKIENEDRDGKNYAPVIFPLLATLEREMKLVFVDKLSQYYDKKKQNLIKYDNLIEWINGHPTLGTIPLIIGQSKEYHFINEKGEQVKEKIRGMEHFNLTSEFAKEIFKGEGINHYLLSLAGDLMTITKTYRNKAVHGELISKEVANECYDFTVRGDLGEKIESTLISFLKRLKS